MSWEIRATCRTRSQAGPWSPRVANRIDRLILSQGDTRRTGGWPGPLETRTIRRISPGLVSHSRVLRRLGRQYACSFAANSQFQLHARALQLHAGQDLIKLILFGPLRAGKALLGALKGEQRMGEGRQGQCWLSEHFRPCHSSRITSQAAGSQGRPQWNCACSSWPRDDCRQAGGSQAEPQGWLTPSLLQSRGGQQQWPGGLGLHGLLQPGRNGSPPTSIPRQGAGKLVLRILHRQQEIL